jgi:chaperonin GroES
MMTGFTPLYDRVLVQPQAAEDKQGSLFVPEAAKEKPLQGEVVALGQGRLNEDGSIVPPVLKVGDVVLYGKFAGDEVRVHGEAYLLLREADVFGVLGD